jgi:hypothetical protein
MVTLVPWMGWMMSALVGCGAADVMPSTAPEAPAQVAQAEPGSMPSAAVVDPAVEALAHWTHILATYVTGDGGFSYEALLNNADDRARLQAYVDWVATQSLDTLEGPARMAFLINAYNANTVKSVLELWPVTSVLEEEGFFDGRTHTIAGVAMTLNALENDHIRTMGDPRIHFAVNCASASCPPLAPLPYTAETLEEMLEIQTQANVAVGTRVFADEGRVEVSQIFEWFAGDFEASGGVRAFLVARLRGDSATFVADESHPITYTTYDWSLNSRP